VFDLIEENQLQMIIILISASPQSLPTGFNPCRNCGTNQQAQKSL
jgi:hypothetical protein